jgi:DNA-binding winged helix-turn-helix (wHTH) protein
VSSPTCYRFGEFVVSRQKRQLFRQGQPVPLIPRYFDLLVLLIERRETAVSKRDIFDCVWGDVIVSDGALSQAVRTLRRVLGDDSREPVFIRTVSRHGYSFVFPGVVEEVEPEALANGRPVPAPAGEPAIPRDRQIDILLERLRHPDGAGSDEDRRDAAEQLHAIDTTAAVERLVATPGHAEALAILRDTRWLVAGAHPVPLLGQREGIAAAVALVRRRLREALRVTGRRWVQAAAGASLAGAMAGLIGGLALVISTASQTPPTAVAVLAVIGAIAGFVGAAGVAAGIALAEALARSRRALAIMAGGALGGLLVATIAHAAARWTLESLFGLTIAAGGPVEGLSLGAAVALGYAATTSHPGGGIAIPSGRARWTTALTASVCAGLAGWLLSWTGFSLVGGIINEVAQASRGSHVALAPLGALVGEPSFGPLTRTLVGAFEGALFGFGLTWGLTARRTVPRSK